MDKKSLWKDGKQIKPGPCFVCSWLPGGLIRSRHHDGHHYGPCRSETEAFKNVIFILLEPFTSRPGQALAAAVTGRPRPGGLLRPRRRHWHRVTHWNASAP